MQKWLLELGGGGQGAKEWQVRRGLTSYSLPSSEAVNMKSSLSRLQYDIELAAPAIPD